MRNYWEVGRGLGFRVVGDKDDWATLAPFLRAQRQMARLSLRALAQMTGVSDSYLSQVERGLHQPSPEVLKAMAGALGISATALYERMGWIEADEPVAPEGVEVAIERDPRLTEAKKAALLTMYRTLVADD